MVKMALHPCGLSYPKPMNSCLIMGKTGNLNEVTLQNTMPVLKTVKVWFVCIVVSLFDTNSMKFVRFMA